ncbi:E3 ubiquitin-protein ligase MARCHF11 isoform X1 [Ambystoma mexicanum]|uniref:E3 ubiquitin-protein ligase MARCHF11 isoform X1 n=1 Tax=Ambystoma mexicanum TaxID=8296 RepID=UPI0037E7DA7D
MSGPREVVLLASAGTTLPGTVGEAEEETDDSTRHGSSSADPLLTPEPSEQEHYSTASDPRDDAKSDTDSVSSGAESSPTPICKICFQGAEQGELLNPCRCDGSVRYTHQLCLLKWISERGSWTCELCCYRYHVIAIKMKRPCQKTPDELDGTESQSSSFNTVNFYCVCCSVMIESTATQGHNMCTKCDILKRFEISDEEEEDETMTLLESSTVQAFAACLVKICFKCDYYWWCYGHQCEDPQQDAHDFLLPYYHAIAICWICFMLNSYNVFQMLKGVYKARGMCVHASVDGLLSKTFLEIYTCLNPEKKNEIFTVGRARGF